MDSAYHSRIPPPFEVRLVHYVGRVSTSIPPSHLTLGLAEQPSPRAHAALLKVGAEATLLRAS